MAAAVAALALSGAPAFAQSAPTPELEAAVQAVQRAGQADADQYAPEPLAAARQALAQAQALGARVSLFLDAGAGGLDRLPAIGADRIELYTGPFAEAAARGDAATELARCAATARQAQALGLGVNAGHDLSQDNLGMFVANVPGVLEVSIGHALIGEALHDGLVPTVRRYLEVIGDATR